MFTLQASKLEHQLLEAGLPEAAVQALVSAIGQCAQDLEHRGKITIKGERPALATDAMLNLDEFSNSMSANFNKRVLTFPLADQAIPPLAKQDLDGPKALDVRNGLARFRDLVRFDMLWAVAQDDWQNVAGDESYVDCYLATKRDKTLIQSTRPDGTLRNADIPIRIYLPRCGSGQDPNVRSGALVGYVIGPDGEAMAVTPYLDGTIGKSLEIWIGDKADISTQRPGWAHQSDFDSRYLCGATGDGDIGTGAAVGIAVSEVDDHSTSSPDGEYTITTTPTGGSVFTTPAAFKVYIIKRTS